MKRSTRAFGEFQSETAGRKSELPQQERTKEDYSRRGCSFVATWPGKIPQDKSVNPNLSHPKFGFFTGFHSAENSCG
jgi:hypothetical protein